ncbi:mitochondrial 18 KDa protein-domain-containing protein [Vararia minispora EC-137]|uniref:Mitochondrial 18 kDa protein-domain-containing protein n=1 Tax=Vararia minispora EC-137 TaxID=1314806 RepID=A0ACB8QW17_9AGAM|nr:mitochondrial 18 KDa protein-domain-containing protein [Vararia minispora EC-137]
MAGTKDTAEGAVETVNELVDKDVDSTDSGVRYAAYAARLRTALRASSRYIAYTSDIGEAFRPVVPPAIVTAAYGISWLYLAGDVSYESYKAHRKGPTPREAAAFSEPARLGLIATKRATFQSIASMALPALTIHTTVSQTKRFWARASTPRLRVWGPTASGLAVVPILPYLFDHPVERVTDTVFDWIEERLVERAMTRSKPA